MTLQLPSKKCAVCDLSQLILNYAKDTSRPDGLNYRCRRCERNYRRKKKGLGPSNRRSLIQRRAEHVREWKEQQPDDAVKHFGDAVREAAELKAYAITKRNLPEAKNLWARHFKAIESAEKLAGGLRSQLTGAL